MWRVKDCKIIACEHVATQHKPLVFVACMQKRTEDKVVSRKTINWWKCSGDIAVAYKERLTLDYGKLGTSAGTVAEELCGRTSEKRAMWQNV